MAPSLRCPRCATVISVTPGQAPVCPGCGFSGPAPRPASGAAPAATRAPAPAMRTSEVPAASPAMAWPSATAGGPVGKVRGPWIVLLLYLVTFGIYGLFYWWTISKEIDAHAGRSHAHPPIKWGLLLMVIGFVLYAVAFFVVLGGAAAAGDEGGFLAAAGAGLLVLLLGVGVLITATVFLLVGQWRIWSTIRDREVAAGAAKPLSPGLQLFFILMPYVNIVTAWIAMYKTQNHLNAIWKGRPGQPD